MTRNFQKTHRRAFTLVEVLVALALLLAGVVAIVQLFPATLRANQEAELLGAAALLAQQKAEEVRRDNDRNGDMLAAIQALTTPTDPVVWTTDDRLTYSYNGRSTFSNVDTVPDPSDDFNVARIIVRLNADYDPSERVIYELRFDF